MTVVKKSNTVYGRPAESQRHIVEELRAQIVAGQLSPGCRLPTRLELERHYSAGATTVQSALEKLVQDGFIVSRGRQGTFVVENPPHLTRYAMVFYSSAPEFAHNRFNWALNNEVRRLRHEQDVKMAEYYGVDGHEDSEDYQRLVREVRAHRIAGLIFPSDVFLLKGTPLLEEPTVPRVAIMGTRDYAPFPVVSLDMESFFIQALDELRAQGRTKVAFLNPAGRSAAKEWRVNVQRLLQERGMETRPYWWQCVWREEADAARESAHLLMRCDERPDALIISDDNLLEFATAGLVASGARVPQEVSVISHCNFPYPTPSALPVQRLGFDSHRIMGECVKLVDGQRQGNEVPTVTKIEAVFEDNLKNCKDDTDYIRGEDF